MSGAPVDWNRGPGGPGLRLAVATFGILSLELGVIRWMGGQIRIIAYFQNFVLLAAFFGMGLGVALGRKRPLLLRRCLPSLALLSLLLAAAPTLGLTRMPFPDPSIALWGAEQTLATQLLPFLVASIIVTILFWAVSAVFIFAGVSVGYLFDEMPPLRAYTLDIAGSLLGVLAMTAAAALSATPVVWLALGAVPLAWLSRRWTDYLALAVVLACAFSSIDGATFSPYNRIDIEAAPARRPDERYMSVNRDFHQQVLNLSPAAVAETSGRDSVRDVYELPFRMAAGQSALIVGSGTGNDLAAALRVGYRRVWGVEIDPTILKLGHTLHPEKPYADPRVTAVNTDARAFFEQRPDLRFDVVSYALLDSHAMFSAMSSLRLDNYVYTVEGIRAGWERVAPGGVLAVNFSVAAGPWMVERLIGVLRAATGLNPLVVPHNFNKGMTFLVGRDLTAASVPIKRWSVLQVNDKPIAHRIPTDDWPFLYLKPNSVPYAYITVLMMVFLTSLFAVRLVYGKAMFSSGHFNLTMFLLGAGFMLLETRMITALSLLFGSTWIVNSSVFAGILAVILAANAFVSRRAPARIESWYLPLMASLVATWLVDPGILNQLPLLARGVSAGLLFSVPVGFAAVVFAAVLRRSPDASGALGSNLMGAMMGGIAEYSSMSLGLRAMVMLALVFYLASLLALRRDPNLAAG